MTLPALAALTVVIVGSPAKAASPDPVTYVANTATDTVSAIDTVSNKVVGTVPVGDAPTSVAVTPNGAQAYVANSDSNSVSVIDTDTRAVTRT
ncbi:hypothetical protein HC028_24665, partial [Planosporangium flavigriseum]|nr:hypothetical protein [Planosporangium flavigriseum]